MPPRPAPDQSCSSVLQNAAIQFAFTAIYLVSLLSLGSLSDNQNSNMQQLTWFPRGRAEPGWTPPTELQQTNLKAFAAMDLGQASQFAAAQALGTSTVWRGGVLLLVSSALHGVSFPYDGCKALLVASELCTFALCLCWGLPILTVWGQIMHEALLVASGVVQILMLSRLIDEDCLCQLSRGD